MKTQTNLIELEQHIGIDYHMKPELYQDTQRKRQREQKLAEDKLARELYASGWEFEF